MSRAQQNKQEVENINYDLPGLKRTHLLTFIIASFFIGFIIYFPFGRKLEDVINANLNSIPGCSLNYNDIALEFFMPKIIIKELNIPNRCTKTANDLFFPLTKLHFRGISFAPLGISTVVETQFNKDHIEIQQSLGTDKQVFRIDDNKINLKSIQQLASLPIDLSGDILLNALILTQKAAVDEANIEVKSKNLVIPAQLVQIISIPELKINSLLLRAEQLNPKQIRIKEFILGDVNSPIRAKFKGLIYPNTRDFASSQIDLKGEFALSDTILKDEKFSMIKFFLNQYNQKDGFYQIKITGSIARPRPSTL